MDGKQGVIGRLGVDGTAKKGAARIICLPTQLWEQKTFVQPQVASSWNSGACWRRQVQLSSYSRLRHPCLRSLCCHASWAEN